MKSRGIDVVGSVVLGGRFWSAYFYDNNGIRLELASSLAGKDVSNVESVLQIEREAREEIETLFDGERDVERWLKAMPLVEEPLA